MAKKIETIDVPFDVDGEVIKGTPPSNKKTNKRTLNKNQNKELPPFLNQKIFDFIKKTPLNNQGWFFCCQEKVILKNEVDPPLIVYICEAGRGVVG